jgi:hypothetical protein
LFSEGGARFSGLEKDTTGIRSKPLVGVDSRYAEQLQKAVQYGERAEGASESIDNLLPIGIEIDKPASVLHLDSTTTGINVASTSTTQ